MGASLYGTATYSSPSALVKSGTHSLSLNGSTYAMLPYSAVHHEAITIAAWVRYNTSGGNWQRLFDFGNGTHSYMFFTPSNGSEMRFVMKNGGEEQILTNGKPLSASSWHHVAITLQPLGDKVQATLYVDGENVAQKDDFTICPTDIAPSLCYIGRSMFKADPNFNGRIDDFRIYSHALSPDAVAAIMTDLDTQSKDISDNYEEAISTHIQAVTDSGQPTTGNTQSYDLSGKPVQPHTKGFLIQGGKIIYRK